MQNSKSNRRKVVGKIIASLVVLVLVFSLGASLNPDSALANAARTTVTGIRDGITIILNGNAMELTPENQAVVIDGRTFLPVRAIADGLGLDVQWDPNTQTVTINDDTSGGAAATPPVTTPVPPIGTLPMSLLDAGQWTLGGRWETVQGAANLPHGATIGLRGGTVGAGAGTNNRTFRLDESFEFLEFTLAASTGDGRDNQSANVAIQNADTGAVLFERVIEAGEVVEDISVELFGATNISFRTNRGTGGFGGSGNYVFVLTPTVR
ncbi:MAG: copper amine oxidase N-terminal domain-containing protein [Oscillospiraceae bacterium]|nr:copper amine oxidase N-terminal domain-containing protein [Oscillospiraceae bacterium]